ncbi:MAG: hypothetical protein Q9215_000130 [Flavoplaca cf. flavocitrina]
MCVKDRPQTAITDVADNYTLSVRSIHHIHPEQAAPVREMGFDKVTDQAKVSGTSHFSNDLGLDSLDTVEVVMAIEEEFSIEIPDKEADAIHSIDKAVKYILSQPDGKLLLPSSLNITDRQHSPLMNIWFGRQSSGAVVGDWREREAYVVYLANTIHEPSLCGSVKAISN